MSSVSVGRHVAARRAGRGRQRLTTAAGAAIALALGLGISLASPNPNFALVFGLIGAFTLVVALVFFTTLEVGVVILAIYLGLLDGPVKLLAHNHFTSASRDVVILAVSAGALLRMVAKRERIRLPPLTGWVFAFTAIVLIGAANPKTTSILKVVGGYRQNLEWVPFFFFGYALIRSKHRFAQMFVILGVLALANGAVSTYQTQIPLAQLSSWGPGYNELINGNINGETRTGVTGRKYVVEGEGHVRPMGLQSDSGGGAGLGVIALPACLALLTFGGPKRRVYASVLALGALVAVITGLGRSQVVGSVIAVIAFALLSLSAGRRFAKPARAILVIAAVAVPMGAVFVTAVGPSLFSRYESIAPTRITSTATEYKEQAIGLIPHYIEKAPFGFGLGTVGPASSFGGHAHELEGHGVTSETQYNFAEDETGAPGLLIFLGICIQIIVLLARWLPKVPDVDIRIALAGVFAVFFAHLVMGVRGAFMDTSTEGPYFWFSFGIAAYWLAGPGREPVARLTARRTRKRRAVAA